MSVGTALMKSKDFAFSFKLPIILYVHATIMQKVYFSIQSPTLRGGEPLEVISPIQYGKRKMERE
jgi:uncharacterized protein (DUF302 family)